MAKRTMDQAIRAYCLNCSNQSKKEVELCPMKKCPLYPFRLKSKEQHPIQSDEFASDHVLESQPTLFD